MIDTGLTLRSEMVRRSARPWTHRTTTIGSKLAMAKPSTNIVNASIMNQASDLKHGGGTTARRHIVADRMVACVLGVATIPFLPEP
jgi:hypothetical protein